MTQHDDKVSLRQMLDHSREAIALVKGQTRTNLDDNRVQSLALTRLIEIIGEAANRVSAEVTLKYTELPWREIISLRNRLVHGYDAVDYDILWRILADDLPQLVTTLEKILADEK